MIIPIPIPISSPKPKLEWEKRLDAERSNRQHYRELKEIYEGGRYENGYERSK